MANCTYGFLTSTDSYSDFAAQSMRLTIATLPSLATVKVYATVTWLSGTQTTYLVTSTGTFNFASAKAVTLKIEPLYNDGYSAGSLTGSIKALNSGGTVLGSVSVNTSVAVVQNVNFAKDDVGGTGADTLVGDSNANDLIGLDGNDVLRGSAGGDQMNGGSGIDAADYSLSSAAVQVTLGGTASGGDAQGDSLIGIEDVWGSAFADTLSGDGAGNRLEGRGGADALNGNGGADILVGGDGNDLLNGGTGADELVGGAGSDHFLFTAAPGAGNVDTMSDFAPGSDQIHLDDAVFSGLATGTLPSGAFALGTAATEADDRILYDPATGELRFDADGAGGGDAILFAILPAGLGTLSAGDFVIF